ncbi:MAG: HlyD family secretion protein [Gemmatimonadales bacterium]
MRFVARLLVGRPATLAAAAALVTLGCRDGDEPDAYGNFETTEVVVSAETPGRLLWFTPTEGSRLTADSVVGVIDTTELALEQAQLVAQQAAGGSRAAEVTRQRSALEAELVIARRDYERTQRLHAQHAATAQQLDQVERDYRVLAEQIEGARAQYRAVRQDVVSTEARIAQIRERLRKSRISSPLGGTVLATYAEAGEFVQAGQPLYKVANLDSMELRAYVTEPQLARVRIGQSARVSIDVGRDERRVLPGTVTWVSSEAEFTPTPIQTREERADLVYALKILVPNEKGQVKIGMPADVQFVSTASAP